MLTIAFGLAFGLGLALVLLALGRRVWTALADNTGEISSPAGLGAAIGVAGPLFMLTRWPAMGVLGAAGGLAVPRLIARYRSIQQTMAKKEAIASWTESLRDSLAGSAKIRQALMASAQVSPLVIRPVVERLRQRLARNEGVSDSLDALGEDLADSTGDLVVTALILVHEGQATDLRSVLTALAHSARDEARMYRRVQAGRAQMVFAAGMVLVVSLSLVVGLLIFNPATLRPYGSPAGQLMLLCVGAIFALGIAYLAWLSGVEKTPRFFVKSEEEADDEATV